MRMNRCLRGSHERLVGRPWSESSVLAKAVASMQMYVAVGVAMVGREAPALNHPSLSPCLLDHLCIISPPVSRVPMHKT